MRVAAVQTTAGPDRGQNLEAAGALVEEAVLGGAALVVLPEYFSVAGNSDGLRRNAEPLAGPTVSWASHLAERTGTWLVAGSFPERPADDAADRRLSNTSCLISPTGSIEAVYRKIHLFDTTVAGAAFCESATMAPGQELQVTPLGRSDRPGSPDQVLGLSLCYDLRFPEMYRIMALLGATVMAVPAAFTAATGPAHWEVLLRARAIENQVFVIGAGQVGRLPAGMPRCHGHSMIVDPWGSILAERAEPGPGVVLADLDAGRQREIRSELPVLANRRSDAYRWPDEETGGPRGHGG
ncbi:MAG: carbon-nitrogen hydrolase family protein [Acidimicrobiales bacterium]|jgi:predicted amidohydrolase